MNKKYILYIFVVLMALSLTLSAVSAEDAAADVLAADDDAVAVEGEAAAGDVVAVEAAADVPIADVETDVEAIAENPYEIVWAVTVTNNGPDAAEGTVVSVNVGDNLFLYDYIATVGEYSPEYGLWYIGELAVNQTAALLLDTIKIDEGPYFVEAAALTLGSYDPNLANNYDIAWADVPEASAAEETMPAAGNPIAMALLALVAIVGSTFSRRF